MADDGIAYDCLMVLSTTDVARSLEGARQLELGALPAKDAEGALALWLHDAGRELRDWQREKVLAYYSGCGLPLYLRLAFEESRRWRSFGEPEACALREGLDGIIDILLDRLSSGGSHGKFLVNRSLGYLATARYGLTEDEMLNVLTLDKEVWNEFDAAKRHDPPERRLPVIVWSRLFLDLEPYLMERATPGGTVATFYHRQLRERIDDQYLNGSQSKERHEALAGYFGRESHWLGEAWRQPNARMAVELVYQQRSAGLVDAASLTLTDFNFVAAKCSAGLVFDLQEDYRQTIEVLPQAQAELAEERRRQERMAKYTLELIAYAKGEIRNLEIPESVEPWSDDRIEAEFRRIHDNPTALDRLRAFAGFVRGEIDRLAEFGSLPGFVLQHALNSAPEGFVHAAADSLVSSMSCPLILRVWPAGAAHTPQPALLRTLEGHADWVRSVTATPDGRRAVSGSDDGTLKVWDLETGACLRTLEGHTGRVVTVSMTPDGRRAVSGSWDHAVRSWDLETGVCLRILEGHRDPARQGKWTVMQDRVVSVSVTPDGRLGVAARNGDALRLWDLDGGTCLRLLDTRRSVVHSVVVTPDGRSAVFGSDNNLQIWDLTTGQCLRSLVGHAHWVESVSVMPDGRRAVSGSADKTARVWDLETGKCLHTLEAHTNSVKSVSVTPDGQRAVSAGDDGVVKV